MRTSYDFLPRLLKIKVDGKNNFCSFLTFKVECVFPMVAVSILCGIRTKWPSGDAPHFISFFVTSLQTLTASSSGSFTIEQLDGIWVDSHWSLALLRTILWHFDATAGFFWSVTYKGWDNSPMAIFTSISVWRRKIIRFPIFEPSNLILVDFFLHRSQIVSLLREVPRIWVFSLFFEIRFSRPLVVKKGGEKKGSLRVAKKRKLDRLTKPKPKGLLESKWTRPMRRIGQFLQF